MMIYQNAPRPASTVPLFRITPDRPLALLAACPAYAVTPLTQDSGLANALGLGALWVKDESSRMGLGSFKALGGAFALAQMILDRSDGAPLREAVSRACAAGMTFITASAGNHGLSVAAGAKVFGAKAVIVLAAAVPEGFADRIRALGADVMRVAGSYEDSVAVAAQTASERGWIHLADGSWDGYIAPPALVMEGYTVLAEECRQSFAAAQRWPTHVFLQAGVGGLAAATAAHIRAFWPVQPKIIVAEPDAAPCLLRSVAAGALTHAGGPVSNMGRLDCKDASLIAYRLLREAADTFVTVSDADAAKAATLAGRAGMASTPSGAAGLAAVAALEPGPEAAAMIILSEGAEAS